MEWHPADCAEPREQGNRAMKLSYLEELVGHKLSWSIVECVLRRQSV